MFTIIIAIGLSGSVFSALYMGADLGLGWSMTLAIATFVAFQVTFGVFIRRKVMRDMESVQAILLEGQKRIQAKMARWQMRPPGSIQAAQKEIQQDTAVFVKEALLQTEVLKRYRFWVPLIEKQMATAQLQLNWMIKEFKKVDELMPKALMLDPSMAAIKLARLIMLNASNEELAKVYKKSVRRLKYNQNVILAGCYSWALIKRNNADEAFKVLTEALKTSDNEILKRNHEHLMNNRVLQFSNSGLGDQWYALHLEEPRVRTQRPHGARFN